MEYHLLFELNKSKIRMRLGEDKIKDNYLLEVTYPGGTIEMPLELLDYYTLLLISLKDKKEVTNAMDKLYNYRNKTIYLPDWRAYIQEEPMRATTLIISPDNIGLLEGQNIVNAVGDFMDALGYELDSKNHPVQGSFWDKMKFIFKKNVTPEVIEKIATKGRLALESMYLGNVTADETLKLSQAASNLINSLKNEKRIAVKCDRILLLKYIDTNGNQITTVLTLDPIMSSYLNENPQCLMAPESLYNILKAQSDIKKPKGLGEGEGVSH